MKKSIKVFLTVCLFVFISTLFIVFASASTKAEKESNNSYSSANTVALGNTITGTISDYDDVDYYKIIAPANGKITVKFNHVYKESNNEWCVTIYRYLNGQYNELSNTIVELDDNESVNLPFIGAVENGIYYIKVVRSYGSGVVGENYKIVTSFNLSNYYEKEVNNAYATASKIVLDKSYTAIINAYDDSDYFKITAPANGKITLKFNHVYEESNNDWCISVYRYANGQYNELSNTVVELDDNESVNLPFIGAVKNGIYYIKIVRSYGSAVVGKNYKIVTGFNSSDYYEKEVNNTFSTANTITIGKKYSGTIGNYDDADYYKLVPEVSGTVKISFSHKMTDNNNDWHVYTYRYSNGQYNELSSTTIELKSDEVIKVPSIKAVKNGVYFIKVVRGYGSNVIGESYSVTSSISVSVVTPKSLKASSQTTTSIKLTWGKVSGAKGYVVYKYNDSNGKYTKVASTTTNGYTIKNLKSATKYKYAVKAYKTVGGTNYYSKYSSILTTATKPVTP